ncbi:MAG: class I SAM-dependent methyltransferase [Oligoflexia bacterium]|nr:class I SAM-dependent methyltransferase [Oligoflexia bacterium]
MNDSLVSHYFGEAQAAVYDDRAVLMKPVRDALNFLIRMALAGLRQNSRILCVGAGTGAELIDLALAFPNWRFTAVEPSAAMLNVCRKKAGKAGVSSRIQFHEGYLDSLPCTETFDAATSILVSQFLTDRDQRVDFFHHIAKRLRPGACLINADLATSLSSPEFERLVDVWLLSHRLAAGSVKASEMGWGKDVVVSAPKEVESILTTAGFKHPILFYQCLFIHAWCTWLPRS